jgi:hypothetical protein
MVSSNLAKDESMEVFTASVKSVFFAAVTFFLASKYFLPRFGIFFTHLVN